MTSRVAPLPTARAPGRRAGVSRLLRRDPAAAVGGLLVLTLFLVALLADVAAPYDYAAQDASNRYAVPGGQNLLGTDHLGRDVLSRLMYGARTSLAVGLGAVGIALIVGVPAGAVAGYVGGTIDLVLTWVMDFLLAVPSLLLAIAVVSALGPGLSNAIIAIAIVNVPRFARLVRSAVLAVRADPFVEAARSLGAGGSRILLRHVLPNVASLVIVRAAAAIGAAILAEAGLSFIGLGPQPPIPSWGGMLNDGRETLRRASHLATFPGLCIMATVLGFNLLGDGLRDALDPRLKR